LALLGVDLGLIGFATVCTHVLYFKLPTDQFFALLPYVATTLVAAVLTVTAFGLNRWIWRVTGMADQLRLNRASRSPHVVRTVDGSRQ
jgi:hypothetical protein